MMFWLRMIEKPIVSGLGEVGMSVRDCILSAYSKLIMYSRYFNENESKPDPNTVWYESCVSDPLGGKACLFNRRTFAGTI